MPAPQAEARPEELRTELAERIRRDGPLPVDRFMRLCLDHPVHGYWRKPDSIGARGDFVTAPEISQVFGELIGLWCALMWEGMGRPAPLRLVELGPGRGTLMRDALRAGRTLPMFLPHASVHLVEVSSPMRRLQREALLSGKGGQACAARLEWHETFDEVPVGPAIVIANEFLDALPIRQLVYRGQAWHERVVGLGPHGGFRFEVGGVVDFQSEAPPSDGAIVELRAGEEELLRALARRTAPHVALIIDYGPAAEAFGDTLQAVRRHAYADPLAEPGAADLTAHVNFAALARKVRAAGLVADGPVPQAQFLGRLGIIERTARLMAVNPARAGEIEAATHRLMSPAGMGQLFKAMAVRSPALPSPPPFG
ncbi:MAG: SAM-dependent methyltransferase [Hyphomicrobiaceae bacterium]|nr:SAM-dependent methyltransferase [Hyphomicrobiaceae bacterium]